MPTYMEIKNYNKVLSQRGNHNHNYRSFKNNDNKTMPFNSHGMQLK